MKIKEIIVETNQKKVYPTETSEFKRWFGNSKIKNTDGTPMVLYHVTPHDFTKFHPGGKQALDGHPEGLSGRAMWFSPNKEYQPAVHNVMTRSGYKPGTNVMPVYLRMERPLLLDNEDTLEWAREVFADGDEMFPQVVLSKWVKEIKDAGYDGIIQIISNNNGDEYIVFNPNQIKSAIGNRGTYATDNDSIIDENS